MVTLAFKDLENVAIVSLVTLCFVNLIKPSRFKTKPSEISVYVFVIIVKT